MVRNGQTDGWTDFFYKTPLVAAFSSIRATQSNVQGVMLQIKIKKNKTVSSKIAKKQRK